MYRIELSIDVNIIFITQYCFTLNYGNGCMFLINSKQVFQPVAFLNTIFMRFYTY